MLCLGRKVGEEILIGEDIKIVVLEIRGQYAKLGIEAPRSISIDRREVKDRKDAEQRQQPFRAKNGEGAD